MAEEAGRGSLDERLRAVGGRLDSASVAQLGAQLAADLAERHERGAVHGAIAPQNVLLHENGTVSLREPALGGVAPVSVRYSSPEVLDGADQHAASDVYSLGATLLAAAIGRPADLTERLGALGPVLAPLTEPLRGVVARCMAVDPADRPLARDVATALAVPPAATGTWAAPTTAAAVTAPPPPPPEEEDDPSSGQPWYTHTGFFVVLALVVLAAGAFLWFALDGDDESATPPPTDGTVPVTVPEVTEPPLPTTTLAPVTTPAPTLAPTTTVVETTTIPPTTVVETTVAPTVPETTAPPLNPFGDVVGVPVTAPTNAASGYALAAQTNGDPAAVAVPHSVAYYFGLWGQMLQVGRADVAPIATADGYGLTLQTGPLTVSALDPAAGPIERIALASAGVPLDMTTAVQPSGVCVPGPDPCSAGFSNPAFIVAADAPTGARLMTLATVRVDPARVTMLMYVDLPGADIAAAGADFADGPVAIDPLLDLVAVSYSSGPPPGTVLTMIVQFTDGRNAVFSVPVV